MQSMSELDPFYTREEVIAARGTAPTRGLWCKECSVWIPQFADLSEDDYRRVRRSYGWALAAAELVAATGCDPDWAEVWVSHGGRPHIRYGTGSCPYCGEEIRNSEAKQCRHRKRDWHDPDNVLVLGTAEPSIES